MHSRNAFSFPWGFPFACFSCCALVPVPVVRVRSNAGELAAFAVPHLPRLPPGEPSQAAEHREQIAQTKEGRLGSAWSWEPAHSPWLKRSFSSLLVQGLPPCPALGAAVLPQRGESQKGRTRGRRLLGLLATPCLVLIDGVWGAAQNFILVRQQLSWAIDDGLKNVMRIKCFCMSLIFSWPWEVIKLFFC